MLVGKGYMLCFATYCLGGFAGQSDLSLWRVLGSCKGGAALWEEGWLGVKIYHFYELFTSVIPYPETTTKVFNLFLVKVCLEKLHSSSGSMQTCLFSTLAN